jgi:hypothetical protein
MKRSANHHGALEPLGFVLQRNTSLRVPAAIETAPISFRDWEAAVGTRIAARARPFRLERGVLWVRTATSTWAQELALLADAIIDQLRGRTAPVHSIRFRVGHVDAPERPPTRQEVRTSPPAVPLPPAVAREVDRIADPDLRAAIAQAAAKSLGFQATLEGAAAPPKSEEVPVLPHRPRRGALSEEATATMPAARDPQFAGPGSAAPGRASRPSRGGRRDTP